MVERLSDWKPAQRMIEAAHGWFEIEGTRLRKLLDESDRLLDPLKDPLRLDFGTHRWLRSQREEAYSDWLSWILERLETAERIFKVLGIDEAEAIAQCAGAKAHVKREEGWQKDTMGTKEGWILSSYSQKSPLSAWR